MGFAVNSTAQRCIAQGFQGCERTCRPRRKSLGTGGGVTGTQWWGLKLELCSFRILGCMTLGKLLIS